MERKGGDKEGPVSWTIQLFVLGFPNWKIGISVSTWAKDTLSICKSGDRIQSIFQVCLEGMKEGNLDFQVCLEGVKEGNLEAAFWIPLTSCSSPTLVGLENVGLNLNSSTFYFVAWYK